MSTTRCRSLSPILVGLVSAMLFTPATYAHHPWVMAEPALASVGQSVEIQPYFGHAFPSDERSSVDRLAEVTLTMPDGESVILGQHSEFSLTTAALAVEGVYVAGTRQARGYWTRTTEGGQRLPRSEVENAVRCSYSDNGSKTLFQVGAAESAKAATTPLGHRLEIVPVANPLTSRSGATMEVKVLFEGQPHAGPLMAFHSQSGEDPYVTTETDAAGRATVTLEGTGPWLLLAHGEIDYPDQAVCDVESFYASLTFGAASNQ